MKNRSTEICIEMPGPEILTFLEKYELGSPGELRYSHTDIPGKLEAMGNIPFLVLRREQKIAGLIGFSVREIQQAGQAVTAYYIRYFSIGEVFRIKGLSLRRKEGKSLEREGILKRFARNIFDSPWLLLGKENKEGDGAAFTYAFIERENYRSSGFGGTMGFVPVRQFYTLMYTRFLPAVHVGVRKMRPEDRKGVEEKLCEFYRNHNLFVPMNLFYRDNYYVYELNGTLVAGIQANPESWVIHDMPGLTGFIFTKLFPFLPFFRRLIRPGRLNFLGVEGIWADPGYEYAIIALIETLMSKNGIHVCMTWVDADGPLIRILRKEGKRGLVGSLFNPVKADVVVRPSGSCPPDMKDLREKPAYLSCLDMT